jgi:RNA polymerase sigma-70 factor (ECF subfamily)
MAVSLETRPSLLLRLRDPANQEAWREFVDSYGPLVYRFARRCGLQDFDAADLTQLVLWQVCDAVSRFDYDPNHGTFRGWLFQVVRHQWCKLQQREQRHLQRRKYLESLDSLAANPSLAELALWDREYEQQIFKRATSQVRGMFADSTWQAFWQTAVEGKDAQAVADQLKLSVGAVYTAKSRVLNRFREVARELREEWDWS